MYQYSLVRRQENSSFANFGRVSVCAVCKCAVLCVGCSLYLLYFLVFLQQNTAVSFFLHLPLTFGGMWRWRRVAVARVFALVVRCRDMMLFCLFSRWQKP